MSYYMTHIGLPVLPINGRICEKSCFNNSNYGVFPHLPPFRNFCRLDAKISK